MHPLRATNTARPRHVLAERHRDPARPRIRGMRSCFSPSTYSRTRQPLPVCGLGRSRADRTGRPWPSPPGVRRAARVHRCDLPAGGRSERDVKRGAAHGHGRPREVAVAQDHQRVALVRGVVSAPATAPENAATSSAARPMRAAHPRPPASPAPRRPLPPQRPRASSALSACAYERRSPTGGSFRRGRWTERWSSRSTSHRTSASHPLRAEKSTLSQLHRELGDPQGAQRNPRSRSRSWAPREMASMASGDNAS